MNKQEAEVKKKIKKNTKTVGHIIKKYPVDPSKSFTVILNSSKDDIRHSMATLGLWTYLIGKPENWVTKPRELMAHFNCGKHKIYSTIHKLELMGYMKREFTKDSNGRITGIESWVAAEPIFVYKPLPTKRKSSTKNKEPKLTSSPYPNFRDTENRNAYKINKDINKKTDLDLGIPDHNIQSSSCLEEEKLNPSTSKPLSSQDWRTLRESIANQIPKTQQETLSETIDEKVNHKDATKEKTSPERFKAPKTANVSQKKFQQLPSSKILADLLHSGTIGERLTIAGWNDSQKSHAVRQFGETILNALWDCMKCDIIEGKQISNIGGYFYGMLKNQRRLSASNAQNNLV